MEAQCNRTVWIHQTVLEFLRVEASAKAPLETGGILMGHFGESENTPVILWASGPGSQAVHQRYYYKPDFEFDECEIARLYKKAGRQMIYLGDWHTHPAPCGDLSYLDKRTLRRIAASKSARVGTPLMLILSYDAQWDVTVWQGKIQKINRYIWHKRFSSSRLSVRLFSGNCLEACFTRVANYDNRGPFQGQPFL